MWQARRTLEPVLGSAVRSGGPAVEFADGLVPVERIVAAVPETFAGVLDPPSATPRSSLRRFGGAVGGA
jgi:hypothetical protein